MKSKDLAAILAALAIGIAVGGCGGKDIPPAPVQQPASVGTMRSNLEAQLNQPNIPPAQRAAIQSSLNRIGGQSIAVKHTTKQ